LNTRINKKKQRIKSMDSIYDYELSKHRSIKSKMRHILPNMVALIVIYRYCNSNRTIVMKLLGKYINRYHLALSESRELTKGLRETNKQSLIEAYDDVMREDETEQWKLNKMLIMLNSADLNSLVNKYVINNLNGNKKILINGSTVIHTDTQ